MRKLLFNLHLYLALVAGVFVIILGATGSIMAFESELDHVFHPKLSYVKPQPQALSLAELSAVVLKEFPGERITNYLLSTSPDISYQIGLGKTTVFVNQYTGEILGAQKGPDFVNDALSFVHQAHLRLTIRNEADTGQTIVKWVGVVILFLLVSGVYLWWPVKRVTIARHASGRRFWFDLHNAVGIFSALFLLALTITGVVIGFDGVTMPLIYKATGSEPLLVYNRAPKFIIAEPKSGATPIPPDQAVEIARAALPGAAPFSLRIPDPKEEYQIRSRYPEDLTGGGRSQVIVDQYSGEVLAAEGSRTAPPGSRIVTANRAVHTGDIFGVPSKALMSFASLLLVAQAVSGVLMWWKRTRTIGRASNSTRS